MCAAYGLHRVRARADRQVDVGLRNAELLKKDVGHRGIVVLAGVDQRLA